MEPLLAQNILQGLSLYCLAGLVFGLVFITALVKGFDPNAAKSAPVQFRLLILPGVIALWPVLLVLVASRAANGRRA